jgi:hypothetical protein
LERRGGFGRRGEIHQAGTESLMHLSTSRYAVHGSVEELKHLLRIIEIDPWPQAPAALRHREGRLSLRPTLGQQSTHRLFDHARHGLAAPRGLDPDGRVEVIGDVEGGSHVGRLTDCKCSDLHTPPPLPHPCRHSPQASCRC